MSIGQLLRRIQVLLHQRAFRDDLKEEMLLHRELRARQFAREGKSLPDSHLMASRQFGNTTLLIEKANDMWRWNWLQDFGQDLRHTVRMLAANPVFTAVAIITLALGIGANTAIFSVTNAVLLRTLPVANPQQIYRLSSDGQPNRASGTGNPRTSFSYEVFEQLRTGNTKVMADLMAYVPLSFRKTSVRAGALPEEAAVEMVSGNFFNGLGVHPLCGRMLNSSDESTHAPVAVVSYGYASRRFGSACAAIGSPIGIKGSSFVIVGVAASSFTGVAADPTDVWIPFQTSPEMNAWGSSGKQYTADPTWWCILMVARLRPGVGKATAETALNSAFERAAYAPLGGKPAPGEKPTRLHFTEARGLVSGNSFEKPLLILQTMVGLLLIIACGNVSMLLAVRNAARAREFSVRLAIGSSRGRLLRQLLAESIALVSCGALLAFLFSIAATRALARWTESEASFAPDRSVLLFTLAISAVVTLTFGLAPAFRASRVSLTSALKISAATAYRDRSRFAPGAVTAALQIALCFTLLVVTGLLVQTLQNLRQVKVGFPTTGLVVFGLSPLHQHGNDQTISFYRELITKLRSVPQVESATLTGLRIASGWSNVTDAIVDDAPVRDVPDKLFRWNQVGPDFFKTLGIQLIAGRDFNEADSQTAPLVAVVDQTFAKRFLNNQNPLGHTVSFTHRKQFTIVGLARNSKYTGIQEDPMPMAWFPYTQAIDVGTMQIELRAKGNPAAVLSSARKVVAEFAPDLALLQPRTQQAEFDKTISDQILLARLSVFFALLAVVLIATGLYGIISYNVTRRTNELGLRIALGAERSQVLWMILRGGLAVCVVGVVTGLPLAFASSRVLASLLYGVTPIDPTSVAVAIIGIFTVGLFAAFLPARRAASADPMLALRYE